MNNKPTGGKRPGSGRHRLYQEVMVRGTIRLPDIHYATLDKIDPNISKAIRAIMDDPKLSRAIRKFIDRRKQDVPN